MADGRSGGRDGGDDGYDWLYTQKGRGPTPPADDSESTQVLPTMGRGGAGRPGGSAGGSSSDAPPRRIAPTPGSGEPPGRRPGRSGGRRPRPRLRWLVYLLLAWVVFLVAVPIYAWLSVDKVDAEPDGERPEDQPGANYLVVGSDEREGLAGRRTDTIMLLHTGDGPNLLMSIPRDSIVEVPGHGTTKINAAFAFGGPELMVQTVEQSTGLYVDHYVEIGFQGLIDLVDAVGGIEICPDQAMNDPQANLNIKGGCQEADGETALGYARSRKTQSTGDIGRNQNQREVVNAIGSEVVSWQTIVNPIRYFRVVTSGANTVTVGEGTGPFDGARFAYAMTRVDGSNGLTCGVPIADLAVNWDAERSEQLFELLRSDRTDDVGGDLCTPTGMPPQ